MADKEKKLGDDVISVRDTKNPDELVVVKRGNLSDGDWKKLQAKYEVVPTVPSDTAAPNPVVAPNGATLRQVQEGGTPGAHSALDEGVATMQGVSDAVAATRDTLMNPVGSAVSAITSGVANPTGSKTPIDPGLPKEGAGASSTPPEASGSGSASLSMSGPGDGYVGPNVKDAGYAEELEEQGRAQGQALAKEARAKAIGFQKQADAFEAKAAAERRMGEIENRAAADKMAVAKVGQDRLKLLDQNFTRLKAEQSKLDPTIDTGRYWKNKSAGQIALGAIAGALFGFAGKGMEYLQQVQQEIQTDIDAQKDTYAQASDKMRREMAAAGDEYARARVLGLSETEAEEAARISKVAAAKAFVEATVSAGSAAEARARAGEVAAGMDAIINGASIKATEAAVQAKHLAEADESARLSAQAAMKHANNEQLRIQASTAGAGAKKAPPASIMLRLQGYDDIDFNLKALEAISGGRGAWGKFTRELEGTPLLGRLAGKELPVWNDATGLSKAAGENGALKAIREGLLVGISKASLTKTDRENFESVLNNVNRLGSATKEEVGFLSRLYREQRAKFVDSNKAYDLSGNTASVSDYAPEGGQ